MLISKWLNSVVQEILSTEIPNMYKVCWLPHQQIFRNSHCCTMLLGHQRPPPMGKIELHTVWTMWLPWWLNSKEYSCQCRRHRRLRFVLGWKISWRRKWQPTPVFMPGEFHGQRAWWARVHGVMKSWTQLSD